VSRLIPIARPVIEKEEREAVLRVLKSGFLVQGEKVREFEARFSTYVGTAHAVATSSGTSAIHAALKALGVGPGDEVILPAITFFACAAMVAACGATPVVVDVGEEDYCLDAEKAAEAVSPSTKGIMPVHIFGQPADMGAIMDLAEDLGLFVLEDACQAHGARYRNSTTGSMGTAGCFSFYPSKIITTGEGGMIVTDMEEVAEYCRMFRDHGASTKYHHEFLGYNYRMTDLAAAIGVEQLRKIDRFIELRRRNADFLTRVLEGVDGISPPLVLPGRTHVFYQYIVRLEEDFPLSREEVISRLAEQGVESRPSYPMPLHWQTAFKEFGRAVECPVAEGLLQRLLEIPVHPSLSAEDLETIGRALEALA
jgi:dTDP-4-amino-4,6-dideoxygalactose transaminase